MNRPLTVLASCMVASAANASDIGARGCRDADLPGLWQNMAIAEVPPGAVTAQFKANPYEYMLFDGKRRVAIDARATPGSVADDEQSAALAKEIIANSGKTGSYGVNVHEGIMTITHNDAPWGVFKCVVATDDSQDSIVKKDDMVWYTVEGVTPYLKRVERKITRPL